MKVNNLFLVYLLFSLLLVSCDKKDKKPLLIPFQNISVHGGQTSQGNPSDGRESVGSNGSQNSESHENESSNSSGGSSKSCSLDNPGHSWGDPHLKTLDGLVYDFQGLGEYWLIRTEDGSGIQVRQEPWKSNKKVTVNTAVAAKLGSNLVSIYLNGKVYVNRTLTTIASGSKIELGGGSVALSGKTFKITLPEGTVFTVALNTSYINVYLTTVRLNGKVSGLLGNCNGNFKDDLTPRDGSNVISPISFNNLYLVFGDSWRLKNGESWFEYGSGESFGSFDGIPEKITTIDPAAIDQAELVCQAQGITNKVVFDACVLDVALTGDPSFAQAIDEAIGSPAAGASSLYYEILAAITDTSSSGNGGTDGSGGSTGGGSGSVDNGGGSGGSGSGGNSCSKEDDDKEHHGKDKDKRGDNGNHYGRDGKENKKGNREESNENRFDNHDGKKNGRDRDDERENNGGKNKCSKDNDDSDDSVSGRCSKNSNASIKNHGRCSIYWIWGQKKKSSD
ncbi:MAG TPA: VWD domain-containing protein [Leptospiraceae bacterium]|nr:VWD domain-containing protein [Leptospiraceae bacterium]HMX34983.1 VWD domain-containing protein [Leptospiraceae bacterium]HMY31222.1 VWD domain-containing protein [Leptospiraceae bacterium]HMZ63291.1 VWD domain-containing protein [Leptospiraceae bacterium]HNA06105.1 VWD domain-containing protein [Leptospiraceae bacterium]